MSVRFNDNDDNGARTTRSSERLLAKVGLQPFRVTDWIEISDYLCCVCDDRRKK